MGQALRHEVARRRLPDAWPKFLVNQEHWSQTLHPVSNFEARKIGRKACRAGEVLCCFGEDEVGLREKGGMNAGK